MRRFLRHRTSTLAALTVLAGLVGAGPLHLLLNHHELCPEHGALVHGDGDHHDEDGPSRAPEPPAPSSHGHDEDRCDFDLLLSAPGEAAPFVAVEIALADVVYEWRSPSHGTARTSLPLLDVAPSHSPPESPL